MGFDFGEDEVRATLDIMEDTIRHSSAGTLDKKVPGYGIMLNYL